MNNQNKMEFTVQGKKIGIYGNPTIAKGAVPCTGVVDGIRWILDDKLWDAGMNYR